MFYVVNMRGLKPSIYTEWEYNKALKTYLYLKHRVTDNVTLQVVSWKTVLKNDICRQLY